jgi:hypothetical protein
VCLCLTCFAGAQVVGGGDPSQPPQHHGLSNAAIGGLVGLGAVAAVGTGAAVAYGVHAHNQNQQQQQLESQMGRMQVDPAQGKC